ncbi:MAG: transglutaminaseTgpA domain-containing protein [Leifsonia sp.]
MSASSWIDLVVVAVLHLLAVVGFEPAFGQYWFLVAAVGGLLVGGGVAVIGAVRRWSVLHTVAVAIAAYFLLGTPLAVPTQGIGVVLPSVDSLTSLVLGAVFGWSDAITLRAPVQQPPYIAVVPYIASWVVAVITATLALRWLPRRPRTAPRVGALLVGPLALFFVAILIGTEDAFFAGIRGVAFAAIALLWLGWRRRGRTVEGVVTVDPSARRRKIVGTAAIVLTAVVVGAVLGGIMTPAAASRYVLRQEVTPPFDPLEYPSPLAGFRTYTKKFEKTDLFSVSGLQDGQLIRLATMDSYDGVVWNVTGPRDQTSGSGSFELLGQSIPAPYIFTPGTHSTARVSIDGYNDVWLPAPGYVDRLAFTAHSGADPTTMVRVNAMTGTSAVTTGVRRGLSYALDVTSQRIPSEKALQKVPPARIQMPPVTNIPDVVAAKAQEYAGSATTAIQKLRNIERSLKTLGYLSHGRASDPVPSRAGEGADRMAELFSRRPMVGDEEQYASAFALMARHLGYPSRVVMGFKPKVTGQQTKVVGGDVTAWSEVAFDGVGWVPFFPTPTKTDAPQDLTTKPKLEPQPQVRQPPNSNSQSDALLTPVKTKNDNPADKNTFSVPGWVYLLGWVIGLPILLYLVPLAAMAWFKRRRRRRRKTTGTLDRRAAGAWSELLDRLVELGFQTPARSTRRQAAMEVERQIQAQGLDLPPGQVDAVARLIDEAVFSGSRVAEEQVVEAWEQTDSIADDVSARSGRLRRQLALFRFHRGTREWSRRAAGELSVPAPVPAVSGADL